MTRDDYEDAARWTANEAMRKIRRDFQIAHPHYTPPTWGGDDDWIRWLNRNVEMHGSQGFFDRGLHNLAPMALAERIARVATVGIYAPGDRRSPSMG